jgi:hypothetical protein
MNALRQGFGDGSSGMMARVWLDGFDGQEDELEDVQKGKLDPPTDDEGPGEVVIRPNQGAIAQEKADEDEEEIQENLETRTPG